MGFLVMPVMVLATGFFMRFGRFRQFRSMSLTAPISMMVCLALVCIVFLALTIMVMMHLLNIVMRSTHIRQNPMLMRQ